MAKGAITLDTQRGAFEITYSELFVKYNNGGQFKWDPLIAKAVRSLLVNMDFFYTK